MPRPRSAAHEVPEVARLRLLASAIAGRHVEVDACRPGEPAWTDGTVVFVDPGLDPGERVPAVAAQCALLAAGSLDPAIVRQFARRPSAVRRYLAVEAHRALAECDHVLPPSVRSLIDHRVAAGLVGPEDSLDVARSRRPVDDPPPSFGTIRPRRLSAAAASVPDSGAGEHPLGQAPRPPASDDRPTLDDLDDLDADDPEGFDVGHLLSSPVGGQGLLGRLLGRIVRSVRSDGGAGPAGADAPTHRGGAPARPGGSVHRAPSAIPATEAGDPARIGLGPRVAVYPEWDADRRNYREAWCTVRERDPSPRDLAPMTLPDGAALRRPLARLGTGLDRTRRRPQGDDIDLDAAVEERVAAMTGVATDGAVYVENLRHRRDLAVLVLLDVSGSAAEAGPAGRTVHEHQRAAAAELVTALHALGDRVALYAFNSQGRTAVHLTRVKDFEHRPDGMTARRLGGLVPTAYTRLGAAVRHAGTVLAERGGTSQRLLVVLSDGFAYDHGYEGRYGEADARRALVEARRRGLGCVCLSVGAATAPEALRRVFGPAAHAAVPTTAALPGIVGPLFRAALRAAEAQRRSYQRIERHREHAELDRRSA